MRLPEWTLGAIAALGLALGLTLAHAPLAWAQDDAADEPEAAAETTEATEPAAKPAPAEAAASDAAPEPDAELDAPGEPGSEKERWQLRAAKARTRVEKARARLAAAEGAYSNMRQRNFPRGDAGAAIEKEVVDAKKALREAEEALAEFGEEADAADVPPAWIDPD